MASKVVQAFYNDDDILLLAVKKVKEAKYQIGRAHV